MKKATIITLAAAAISCAVLAPGILADEGVDDPRMLGKTGGDSTSVDTTGTVEQAPLDIAKNRGLFIITPDKRMQMRILGSVRFLVVYDGLDLETKSFFDTSEIPTGDRNRWVPSYFNGLEQTRLGFEVTRRTSIGDVFARLETDFAGPNGFRIRHAYGQYGNVLFGQTWSLFSQISALPVTVDFNGPTGAVSLRTPQLRYSRLRLAAGVNVAVGLEYTTPDLDIPDSLAVEVFQLLPTLSLRLDRRFGWGSLQASGILPVMSGRDAEEDLLLEFGWGAAASAVVDAWADGRWYISGVGGKGINSFINNLAGTGADVLFGPGGASAIPVSFGGYVTYEHSWRDDLVSNLGSGLVQTQKISFAPDDSFYRGYTVRLNTFWDVVEGAKIGGELIWGRRVDKDLEHGDAVRASVLFYYDY